MGTRYSGCREGAELLPSGTAQHDTRQATELGVVVVLGHEIFTLGVGELLDNPGEVGIDNGDFWVIQGLLHVRWQLY